MAEKLTLLLCVCAVSGLFVSPSIRNVPGSQLWSLVQASDYLSVILTYADGNALCEKLEPHILTVAETYKELIRFYAVECHTVVEYECTPEMEKTLPGLLLAYPSGTNFTTGEPQLFKERYTGQMNMKSFGEYLLNKMPFYGYTLTFATIPAFIKTPAFNKTILFTDKETAPSMFKALSAHYRDRLQFAIVWKNQTEIAAKYNVKFFPTILTFARGKTFEYDGEIAFNDLKWYYSLHANPEKAQFVTSNDPEYAVDQVRPVDAAGLSKTLKLGKTMVMTLFYAGEKPTEEWTQLRTRYKGLVQFLEMNCSTPLESEQADLHGVTEYPSYLLYPVNRALSPLPLSLSNATDVLKTQYRSEIISLDGMKPDMFQSLLKNSGKLVSLLVADDVILSYHALANELYLKSMLLFTVFTRDASQFPGSLPINRRPGIVTLASIGDSVQAVEYPGRVEDFSELRYYFEENIATLYHNTRPTEEDWTEETIDELTQRTFTKTCGKKTPYCLIALLNGGQETSPETMELMKKMKAYSERTNKPFRFLWVDGRCEFEFLKAIPLYETQLPVFLIYQGGLNRTLPIVDEMDEIQLKLKIDKVSAGKFPSEETAVLSLTDRNCDEVRSFYEALSRVPNEHRREELKNAFYRDEEYKLLNNKYNKRTGKKPDL